MKIAKRVVAGIVAAMLMSSVFAAPAFAARGQYYYDFQKGEDPHVCGPVVKDDNEQNAYISIKRGDVYFEENKSAFGTRVRLLSGEHATVYRVWTQFKDSQTMGYYTGRGNAGWNYKLYAQVDDSSQTQWVRIWGYWFP